MQSFRYQGRDVASTGAREQTCVSHESIISAAVQQPLRLNTIQLLTIPSLTLVLCPAILNRIAAASGIASIDLIRKAARSSALVLRTSLCERRVKDHYTKGTYRKNPPDRRLSGTYIRERGLFP